MQSRRVSDQPFLCATDRGFRFRGFIMIENAIELDAEVEQLRAQMIEPRFQVAHVALRRNIDEVQHLLDVAIERRLVRHEAFAGLAETRAHPVVGHDLVEKARDAFLAHLAEPVHQVVVVAACHRFQLYIEGRAAQIDEHNRQHSGYRVRLRADGVSRAAREYDRDVGHHKCRADSADCDRRVAPRPVDSSMDDRETRSGRVGSGRGDDYSAEPPRSAAPDAPQYPPTSHAA